MRVKRMQGEILTKRPEGMDYKAYRVARKEQERQLKNRLRFGFMMWPSKGIFNKEGVKVESRGTLKGRVPALEFVD